MEKMEYQNRLAYKWRRNRRTANTGGRVNKYCNCRRTRWSSTIQSPKYMYGGVNNKSRVK